MVDNYYILHISANVENVSGNACNHPANRPVVALYGLAEGPPAGCQCRAPDNLLIGKMLAP